MLWAFDWELFYEDNGFKDYVGNSEPVFICISQK
jgi:hypothetical protein